MLNLACLALLVPLASSDDPVALGIDAMRAHYTAVEVELHAASISHLDAERRKRREALLQALARYRERGDFGQAFDPLFQRPLRFVDDEGRRCAVAELLHVSGRDDLVEYVAAHDNEAFVVELATEPELVNWLDHVGLTLDEAARIQMPSTHVPRPRGEQPAPPGWDGPGGPNSGPSDPSAPLVRADRLPCQAGRRGLVHRRRRRVRCLQISAPCSAAAGGRGGSSRRRTSCSKLASRSPTTEA